jgi:hypothetical protein
MTVDLSPQLHSVDSVLGELAAFPRDYGLQPRTRPRVLNRIFTIARRYDLELAGIEAGLLLRLAGLDVEHVVDRIEALGERGQGLTVEQIAADLSQGNAKERARERTGRKTR